MTESKRPSMLEVTPIAQTDGFRLGHVGPLVVMVFDGATSLKQLDVLEAGLEFVLQRYPKYSTFAYLRSAILEKPPAGMNERAQAIENRLQPHIVSKVMVVIPTGLSAVLIRSFLAVQSLMSANLPTKVFRTDDEAVAWLQALPEQLPEIQKMIDLTGVLRRFGMAEWR